MSVSRNEEALVAGAAPCQNHLLSSPTGIVIPSTPSVPHDGTAVARQHWPGVPGTGTALGTAQAEVAQTHVKHPLSGQQRHKYCRAPPPTLGSHRSEASPLLYQPSPGRVQLLPFTAGSAGVALLHGRDQTDAW